ncbi:MAG: class I SAM-dependent methyltransferase [Halioglobus sp.]
MNHLEQYFLNNPGNMINKWTHYFEIYDSHLSPYRGTDVHILEIGVRHGGSLQMWKDYFGPAAKIYGVDINPRSRELEEEQIEIFIGDQGDPEFLAELQAKIPRIDILLDDGGHTMKQQILTFEMMFPHLSERATYICEDTHTSYWNTFGGGFRRDGTFMETAKGLVDDLHGFHKRGRNENFRVTDYTKCIDSLHFYDSMVVIEKEQRNPPESLRSGNPVL